MTEQELTDYIVAGNRRIKFKPSSLVWNCCTMFYWKDKDNKNIPGAVLQLYDKNNDTTTFQVIDDISLLEVPSENER